MRYHCLSPDTFFFSVSLAFRKCAHSCLASLCHSSTATANLLHQPSRVGCSASTLIHLFYTSRLEAGSSFHAHINLQTPNILSSLGCGATYYFSVLNFRFKVPSDIPWFIKEQTQGCKTIIMTISTPDESKLTLLGVDFSIYPGSQRIKWD